MTAKSNPRDQRVDYVDELPETASFDVPENGSLSLRIASFKNAHDCTYNVTIHQGGSFSGAFADFSRGKMTFKLNVICLGENTACSWHGAFLAAAEDEKRIEASVSHQAPHQEALMSNYGIARGSSKLVFAGVSEIQKGAMKTKTRQEAKIIVFDPTSDALASPILKIGDNDVDASHGAVVGRLNEEHLFYLQSRGLSLEEAKRLITLGYLKPITQYFDDEALVSKIDAAIEGGMNL